MFLNVYPQESRACRVKGKAAGRKEAGMTSEIKALVKIRRRHGEVLYSQLEWSSKLRKKMRRAKRGQEVALADNTFRWTELD